MHGVAAAVCSLVLFRHNTRGMDYTIRHMRASEVGDLVASHEGTCEWDYRGQVEKRASIVR